MAFVDDKDYIEKDSAADDDDNKEEEERYKVNCDGLFCHNPPSPARYSKMLMFRYQLGPINFLPLTV